MKTKGSGISKARQYAKSHMWCTFAAVIGAAVLLLLLVLLFYMRGQYYSFLLRTTYSTQEALLDTVEENLERLLDSYVWTVSCCMIRIFRNQLRNTSPARAEPGINSG